MSKISFKDRNKMYQESGTEIDSNSYLIKLANHKDKDSLNAERILLGSQMNEDFEKLKKNNRRISLMLAESAWKTGTKDNEELVKYRVDVEKRIVDETNSLTYDKYLDFGKTKMKSIKKQAPRAFEVNLIKEVKDKLAIDYKNEKVEGKEPELKTEQEIIDFIYSRVNAYYKNEFHYEVKDSKVKKAETIVETIGV